jgi:hypothetical protein
MKTGNVLRYTILSVGIGAGIFALYSYIEHFRNPPRFAPKSWDEVNPQKIQSIAISPLLMAYSKKILTIDKTLVVKDSDIIASIWKEMSGKEHRDQAPGKWVFTKALKLSFQLLVEERHDFRVTFHYRAPVADYYMIEDPDDYYYGPNFAGKGSGKLNSLLLNLIESHELSWVNANRDYWKLEPVLELKEKASEKAINER